MSERFISYEEHKARQIVKMLQDNPAFETFTYRNVINTLEAYRLTTVAAWYWNDRRLSEAMLDLEVS